MLNTRLRYLLNTEKDLAIWQSDADWRCGLAVWRTDRTPAAPPEKIRRWRELVGDARRKRARHPADLVLLLLRKLGGPVEFHDFAAILAQIDGIGDAPAGLPEPDSRVSGHFDYAAVAACSEGQGIPAQLAHLRECAMCQAEVLDLSRFRTKLAETPRANRRLAAIPKPDWTFFRIPLGLAAAAALLVSGVIWTARHPSAVAPVAQSAREGAPLPPAERQLLERAVASQRLERAPVLDRLALPRHTPPGSPRTPPFRLLSPVGTTVVTDRPLLRWTPAIGATGYIVAIFDGKSERIAESPTLAATDWLPPKPLPRGELLLWQVIARTREGELWEPRPPARFEVVSRDAATHIELLRRQYPGNSLLMAVLFARVGALDDAGEALRAMDPAAAQRYRESLAKIRNPE